MQDTNGETEIENRLMDMGGWEERVRCMERVTWKLNYHMENRQWEFAVCLRELKQGLCINLEGWGGRFKREETYVHLWLIHTDV